MGNYHTHDGVRGSHKVDIKHKDPVAQKAHNQSLGYSPAPNSIKKDTAKKTETKIQSTVSVPVDVNGYINLNLDDYSVKGLKLAFTRKENSKKRTFVTQIENKACKQTGRNKKLAMRIVKK